MKFVIFRAYKPIFDIIRPFYRFCMPPDTEKIVGSVRLECIDHFISTIVAPISPSPYLP